MAQKKLLFVLICMLVTCTSIHGSDGQSSDEPIGKLTTDTSIKDIGSIGDLTKRSRMIMIGEVKKKWQELHSNNNNQIDSNGFDSINMDYTDITLRIFVSSSMGIQLLKRYVEQMRQYQDQNTKYQLVLVFNGLPNNSWNDLLKLIEEITNSEATAIVIDDEAFTKFGISRVPSFVLSKQDMFTDDGDFNHNNIIYDKVTGNIGIKRALEVFARDGDLSAIALSIEQNKNNVRGR